MIKGKREEKSAKSLSKTISAGTNVPAQAKGWMDN